MNSEELNAIVDEVIAANPNADPDVIADMVYEAAEYYPTPAQVRIAVREALKN